MEEQNEGHELAEHELAETGNEQPDADEEYYFSDDEVEMEAALRVFEKSLASGRWDELGKEQERRAAENKAGLPEDKAQNS